jgi:hypothetical protein
VIAVVIILVSVIGARSEQQTRFYGPDGKSIGTAVPLGNGTVRYYDSRGNSLGTSTTTGNTTRFYDVGGKPTGSFQFDGRMRRPGLRSGTAP